MNKKEEPRAGTAERCGISPGDFLRQFPMALQPDNGMMLLAEVIARELAVRWGEAELGTLYARMDELPEPLLDILAYDFKVDWWNADYSLEEKRRTLKDSWRVHKTLGTKAAVETAISAIYPDTKVSEWWEYGGRPYHFKLCINVSEETIASEKLRQVLTRVRYYKNLRSHNDGVTYFMRAAEARGCARAGGIGSRMCLEREIPIPAEVLASHVRLRPRVGVGTAGIYQVVKKEVPVNGALA